MDDLVDGIAGWSFSQRLIIGCLLGLWWILSSLIMDGLYFELFIK